MLALDPPLLTDGMRLTQPEFRERYEQVPDVKAELIEGEVVIMASPVSGGVSHTAARDPGLVARRVLRIGIGPGFRSEGSVILDDGNEYRPDLLLLLGPRLGGRATLDDRGFIIGVPDLAIEIGASSARHDATVKRAVYERRGVPEYLAVRPFASELDWWHLRDGAYKPVACGEDGILRSPGMPGLWLDAAAIGSDRPR